MKLKINNFFLLCSIYLITAALGIWFLTKMWIPDGYVISGHDSGLPLDTKMFLNSRLFAWDDRLSFGIDNSLNFGSLTLHTFDYLFSKISGVTYAGNNVSVWFWISLMFFSGFIFAISFKKRLGNYFPFLFPIFITINFFIFQSIFMLERAKYGLLAATLVFLTYLFKVIEGRSSLFTSAFVTSVVFSIFNGGSLYGLPLYGSPVLIIFVVVVFYLILGLISRNFENLKHILAFLLLTGFLFLLFNSYAIIPYLPTFLNKDFVNELTNKAILNNREWVDYISQASSFLNIFRLQGIPSWYLNSFTLDSNHPYASFYNSNQILIFLSLIFPIAAFSSIFICKKEQRKIITLFTTVALVSMFFVAGTHRPLGFLYGVLFNYLPGFSIFRTPYYKFGTAFIISISFLIAFSSSVFIEKVPIFIFNKISSYKKKIRVYFNIQLCQIFLLFIALFLWLSYHYVLFSGQKVFNWSQELTTRVKVPDYVWEFKKLIEYQGGQSGRILLTPPINEANSSDSYVWGYWSLSPLTHMLTSAPTLTNELNLTKEQSGWVEAIYSAIKQKNETLVLELSERLGIEFFLLREDVTDINSVLDYKESLNYFSSVKKIKMFDNWTLYHIDKSTEKNKEFDKLFPISPVDRVALVPPGNSYLAREFAERENIIFDDQKTPLNELDKFANQKISVHTCLSCLIEQRDISASLPLVRILPTTPFYFLKEYREKMTLKGETDPHKKILDYLGFVLRRVSEIQSMLFLGAKESDVTPVIDKTVVYLKEAKKILRDYSNPKSDFLLARQTLDLITPVQERLKEYVGSGEFSTKEESLRNGMYEILLQVNEMENFYNPLLEISSSLRYKKVFLIKTGVQGDQEWYFNPLTFPTDRNGKVLLPKKITLGEGGDTLKFEVQRNGWVKIEGLQKYLNKELELIAYFSTPDLLIPAGLSTHQLPTGPRNCMGAKIAGFDSAKTYEITTSVNDKTQILRIAIRDEYNGDRKKNAGISYTGEGFFKADNEVRISPIEFTRPFKYQYKPAHHTKDPTVYVCSSDLDPPDIKSMEIYEAFSPTIVSVIKNEMDGVYSQSLKFNKKNPTEYTVSAEDKSLPFILLFNQAYSPSWNLYRVDGKKPLSSNILYILFNRNKDEKRHFLIDGYSNGWIVDPKDGKEWILIYSPQLLFYLGVALSGFSFVVALTYLILRLKYYENKKIK